MADQALKDPQTANSWDRPADASFAQWMETRVARHSTRKYDWNALKFQADYDPKYRRAQMRYVGTGGTGVAADANVVPAGHFTFSTMLIPAGGIGPMHIHTDVEEIFFVMRGRMKVFCEKRHDDGRIERWEATLGERDLISIPPGVYREEHNIGEEDALMCVMLGASTPVTPTYPPESPLAKIKR
jgi:mannose-6-phosphate isomerase-like protein (cupin superfamily)